MTSRVRSSEPAASPSARLRVPVVAGTVLVMVLWAVCFPLIAVGLENSPPMTLAALRAASSGLVLLIVARALDRPRLRGRATWRGVILIGLTATSIGFFGMFYGGERVSPGIATVIANTQPLIAAALAWIALGERLSPLRSVALVAAFAGIVLIGASDSATSTDQAIGVLFILLGAAGVAISNVALKRLAGRADVVWAMGWQLAIGSLPLIVLALALEDPKSTRWGIELALSAAALSVLGTALPFVLWFGLLRQAGLTRLNVFSFLTPVFGLLAGELFFEERIGAWQAVAIALSVASIYVVSRSPNGDVSSVVPDDETASHAEHRTST